MSRAFRLVLILVLSIAGGALSAAAVLERWPALSGEPAGAWRAEPAFGVADADPYTRAVQHMRPRLLHGPETAMAYVASADDDGAPLDPACTYEIRGVTPIARLLTLRAQDAEGRTLLAPAPLPSVVHSDLMIFEGDGFTIAAGPRGQPGNWLAVRADAPYRLVFTAYDASLSGSETAGAGFRAPTIRKRECQP